MKKINARPSCVLPLICLQKLFIRRAWSKVLVPPYRHIRPVHSSCNFKLFSHAKDSPGFLKHIHTWWLISMSKAVHNIRNKLQKSKRSSTKWWLICSFVNLRTELKKNMMEKKSKLTEVYSVSSDQWSHGANITVPSCLNPRCPVWRLWIFGDIKLPKWPSREAIRTLPPNFW